MGAPCSWAQVPDDLALTPPRADLYHDGWMDLNKRLFLNEAAACVGGEAKT